jgi:hypothetical protein
MACVDSALTPFLKVTIPYADFDAKLGHIQDPKDIAGAEQLQPLDDLSDVFQDPPARKHVHIIVQPPTASEC